MFADDAALLADTATGLQIQLNELENFCNTSGLTLITGKSKIMLFFFPRNGGNFSLINIGHTKVKVVNPLPILE